MTKKKKYEKIFHPENNFDEQSRRISECKFQLLSSELDFIFWNVELEKKRILILKF